MTTHKKHRCRRRHRSYRTLAKCVWHRALVVKGEGPFAIIAGGRPLVISLWETYEMALYARWRMVEFGRIERLVDPGEAEGI